jgi:hypothetical protein
MVPLGPIARRNRSRIQEAEGGQEEEGKRRLTPADLRVICDTLNDEHGTGGQSRLARLLGWHYTTVWRKLNGKSPIKQDDELAIQKAVEVIEAQ